MTGATTFGAQVIDRAPPVEVVDDGTTFATEADLRGLIENQIVAPKVALTPISYGADRLVASGAGESRAAR